MNSLIRKVPVGTGSVIILIIFTVFILIFKRDVLSGVSRSTREVEEERELANVDSLSGDSKGWKVSSIIDMNVAPNIRKSFPKRASYYHRLEKKKKKKKKKKLKKGEKTE
ncbi:UNVERIFIED_CONTAM: hypothetical protein RMT77_010789 [Armadillidium vulgare]